MIRLAPRMVAAEVDLIRGVRLQLEAATPTIASVAMRDAAERVRHLSTTGASIDDDALRAVTVEVMLAHLALGWTGVEDEHGAPVPFSVPAWRELAALDPRIVSHARDALDRHFKAAEEASAEGNASPASAPGAHEAG